MAPEEPTDFSSDSDSDSDSEAIALASTLTSLNTSLSQLELDFIQPLLAQTLADTLASLPGELDKAKLQVGLGYVIHDLVWSKCSFPSFTPLSGWAVGREADTVACPLMVVQQST
jgi:hypothetical protein